MPSGEPRRTGCYVFSAQESVKGFGVAARRDGVISYAGVSLSMS